MPRILRSPGSKSFRLENVSVPNAGGATSQAWLNMNEGRQTEAAFGMTGALGGAGPLCNTDNQRPLQAPSASLAISAAISFASFAQLVLVEAGLSQFGARISPNWSLAGLPVSAAISFAPLA